MLFLLLISNNEYFTNKDTTDLLYFRKRLKKYNHLYKLCNNN